jgi:PAS domain-containing protein
MPARRKTETRLRNPRGMAALLALSQAALDGVSEGVCVYDENNRIVLFNRRYLELFNLSPDVIKPGISYAEVLVHSASLGNFPPESLDGLICQRHAMLAAREAFSIEQILPSGVVMTLDIRPLPMADGSPFATTSPIAPSSKRRCACRPNASSMRSPTCRTGSRCSTPMSG